MKILVDARSLVETHGGVSRVALRLVQAYAENFPDDRLILATTGKKEPTLPKNLTARANVSHTHIAWPNKLWSVACLLKAVSLVTTIEKKAGLVDAFFMPNIGFIGRWPKDKKTILLLHDLSFLIEPKWFKTKQRWWHRLVRAESLIKNATKLLAVSQTTKRDAIKIMAIPEEKISVMPIGSTLSAEAGFKPTTIQRHRFLALGLGDPRKNAATVVAATRSLRQEVGFEDSELVLVGTGSKPAISPGIEVGRLHEGWIHVIARPSDAELALLYASATAFLYPSWYEGYGLPLHEAASFGTPCVASSTGALPETAPPGTLFAHPAKPHHWVEAMKLIAAQTRKIQPPEEKNWERAALVLRDALTAD